MAEFSQTRQAIYMRHQYLRERGLLPPLPTKLGGAVIKRKKDEELNPMLAKREAIAAWKRWIHELAPSEWLDGYYAATGRPWTDHRLTDASAFGVRYRHDAEFKRKWLDARNKRRALRRKEDPGYDKPKRRDDRKLPIWRDCG